MSAKTSPRLTGCNVLSVGTGPRHLWQFEVVRDGVKPGPSADFSGSEKLPAKAVARDWRLWLRPRVDVAWLPLDQVFLRVIQLPTGDPAELPGMIEFQIEKLSPLPPPQVAWTVEALPHPGGQKQTAVVTLVPLEVVEGFLGSLEKDGYVADRLENPLLCELLAKPETGTRLCVRLQAAHGGVLALVSWWVEGVLQELGLMRLPETAGAATLVTQLNQMAWAGEMEGWIAEAPSVRITATAPLVAEFRGPLEAWSGRPVDAATPMDADALASLTAKHALPAPAVSLVPPEIHRRQRQKYIETLWVRGLAGVAVAYLAVVFMYLGWLTYKKSALDTLRDETSGMARQYTNTLQIKAQVRVLQEQVALRYAALDCWRAVIDKLPESLTLTQLDFKGGRTLLLDGTTTEEGRSEIIRFNSELRSATANGQPLFSEVKPATTTQKGGLLSWRFEADLRREDLP
jgi:hypothetical protein